MSWYSSLSTYVINHVITWEQVLRWLTKQMCLILFSFLAKHIFLLICLSSAVILKPFWLQTLLKWHNVYLWALITDDGPSVDIDYDIPSQICLLLGTFTGMKRWKILSQTILHFGTWWYLCLSVHNIGDSWSAFASRPHVTILCFSSFHAEMWPCPVLHRDTDDRKKHLTDGARTFSSVIQIDHAIFGSAVYEWCSAAADLEPAEMCCWEFG